MKKCVVLLMSAIGSVTAMGQDLVQCVNPDVINTFLTGINAERVAALSSDPLTQLEGHQAPASFEWIGSTTGSGQEIAAWRTGLELTAAQNMFADSLRDAGFSVWPSGGNSGFVLESVSHLQSVCRDSIRGSFSVRDLGYARIVNVSLPPTSTGSCEEAMAPEQLPAAIAISQIVPMMMLPSEVSASQRLGTALFQGSGDSSGSTYRLTAEVEGVSSVPALADDLAIQIREQGWSPDATWSGDRSAGSTWILSRDDGPPLAGKLTVEDIGNGYFRLQFLLLPTA